MNESEKVTNFESGDPRVDLAVQRTDMALERTQLAWVRTAFMMISAGLAVDQAAYALSEAHLLARRKWSVIGHVGGIVLAVSGSLLLGMATVSYFRRARALARAAGEQPPLIPNVLPLSVLVVGLGFVLAGLLAFWE